MGIPEQTLLSGKSVGIESCDNIHLFLKAQFACIAEGYPDSLPCTWLGPMLINELTRRAAGLFISASTVTEFIEKGEPKQQLRYI
jgi:hypothetical protein